MASTTRTSFTLDEGLADQARSLGINVSAAARDGVRDAVREALARADRVAYQRHPEHPNPFWGEVEAWTDD